MYASRVFFVVCLIASIAACKPKGDSTDTATADGISLSGPIPQCKDLVTADRRGYRIAGVKECASANTMDARMTNVGCAIKEAMSKCMNSDATPEYTLEQYQAEKAEGLK